MSKKIIEEVKALLDKLKPTIQDIFRANEDEDDEPGMSVTIATNDGSSWVYQTGDNSYTGSCYHYHYWGVMSLYRDSDTLEIAKYYLKAFLPPLLERVGERTEIKP
jgi:hypothetical protein